MPPRIPKLKTEESTSLDTTWRSRFPVARIKKIMQADEDVGKVAQVVPVIISKSLELFMASMVQEASLRAVETGHKRVLPGHLRLAVKRNTMFDFLEPLVDSIPDPVHVGAAKSLDEAGKKGTQRKPRSAKRPTTEDEEEMPQASSTTTTTTRQQEEMAHDGNRDKLPLQSPPPPSAPSQEVVEHGHQHKKVKSEDTTERQPASRSMSIANMMSNDYD